jgi:hypothetical protein
MEQKYQLDNPNNCRVKIDFNKSENPVTFEYVGKRKPFAICYTYFMKRFWSLYSFPFVLLMGFGMGIVYYSYQTRNTYGVYATYFFMGEMIFIMYVLPFLLGLLFSKTKLIRLMPLLWSSGRTRYYLEVNPINIQDNKFEIPLFNNMFLGYELSGDFLDKINTIEIIEHPFNILVKRPTKNKPRKLKPNENLWKATFYFNETPKDGQLKIMFV